ncbi:MAG: hypothetical protein AAF959_05215 [Cyanobacteria bacterium P01_D01_bin.56]
MTNRMIVLTPDWDHIPDDPDVVNAAQTLGWGADYSGTVDEKPGYRPIHEYSDCKYFHRPGPWVVLDEGECYSADIPGMQAFDEIMVFKVGYDPLPEAENPWIKVIMHDPTTFSYENLTEDMGLTDDNLEAGKESLTKQYQEYQQAEPPKQPIGV